MDGWGSWMDGWVDTGREGRMDGQMLNEHLEA